MDSEQVNIGAEQQVEAAAQPENAASQTGVKVETAEKKQPSGLEDLKPGMRLQGRVRHVVDFGAFVDIGVGRDGLAHISTLKRAGIDKTLQVGDALEVIVRRIDTDTNRISLTVPGAERSDKPAVGKIEVGTSVTGRVVRLVDFGAFVDIGAQTDGLVHISQLPGGYVRHPSDVVKVGDEVQVRILEVDTGKRRISLSMKDDEAAQGHRAVAQLQRQQAEEDDGNQGPTAFEVAWQKAVSERKGGR
jgi:transcriptional accessory protein Tex/SPT6